MSLSPSLLLVWQLAVAEAETAHSGALETGHLLLGVCKLPDLPLDAVLAADAPREVKAACAQAINETSAAFAHAGVAPKDLRRRVRYRVHQCETQRRQHEADDAAPEPDRAFFRL